MGHGNPMPTVTSNGKVRNDSFGGDFCKSYVKYACNGIRIWS